MSAYNFKFVIEINNTSTFLKSDRVAKLLNSFNKLTIVSNEYSSYELCEKDLLSRLASLIGIERKTSNEKDFVIVKKRNPLFDKTDESPWNLDISYKFFAADAQKIDAKVIDYPVSGYVQEKLILEQKLQ